MGASLVLFLILAVLPTAASAVGKDGLCKGFAAIGEEAVKARRPGHIAGFNYKIEPPFSRKQLEANIDELTPNNSKYVLGRMGPSHWVVESRTVPGTNERELVAVKYHHLDAFAYIDPRDDAKDLAFMQDTLTKTGTDSLFGVLQPKEVTTAYAVFPFEEAQNFLHIAKKANKDVPVPAKRVPGTELRGDSGGPPPASENPEVALLWERHQAAMQAVAKAAKKLGYKVGIRKNRSWRTGEQYIDVIEVSNNEMGLDRRTFTIRVEDTLVTSDGRFVISDPF